jgi:arginyl-tRNA synthetase
MNDLQEQLKTLLAAALKRCVDDDLLSEPLPAVPLSLPKRPEHGDFACTVALMLAKKARRPPREVAQAIVDRIRDPEGLLDKVEIAGPGFINLKLNRTVWYRGLKAVLASGKNWGRGEPKANPRINIEFVSANPTGPLHVGHGRGAAVGDALARLLRFAGFAVTTEYYLNDAGRQVKNLGLSVWIRALELLKSAHPELDPAEKGFADLAIPALPEDGYRGQYIKTLAEALIQQRGAALATLRPQEKPQADLEPISRFAAARMQEAIAETLKRFHVTFDVWTSERMLHERGAIETALSELADRGLVYEKQGARWFRTQSGGDEKDRVVVRENGQPTYFAADIAYHKNKFARGFDHLIDIWGADHHGYVPRMKAAVSALNQDPEAFETLLVQFVTLRRGGKKQSMGKRSGTFVTVDDLIAEVGTDVVRYFFLERRHDSHIDFDIEVATSQDPTVNPAVYVQYGHARACSILKKAAEELEEQVPPFDMELAQHLTHPDEIAIMRRMVDFPILVAEAAAAREPHRVVNYLFELSRQFQSYYTRTKNDPVLPPPSQRCGDWKKTWNWSKTRARLMWVNAVRIISATCLELLGLSAPAHMERLEEAEG